MNKKKLVVVIAALCAVLTIAIGGTLAYFVDSEIKANVFTVGNVQIDLIENFGDNNPDTPEKLYPATGSAQQGNLKNGIKKEVSVKNTGTEEAYVRVHIAIPSILDDGADTFDASANVLHFNFDKNSVGAGKWDWSKTTGAEYTGDWNYYTTTVDNVSYNVYVVTYESKLAANEETPEKAIHQVYLDSKASNDDVAEIVAEIGENWQILVLAEGVQTEGFKDAYEALNTAFGVPGSYVIDWSAAEKQ